MHEVDDLIKVHFLLVRLIYGSTFSVKIAHIYIESFSKMVISTCIVITKSTQPVFVCKDLQSLKYRHSFSGARNVLPMVADVDFS